METGRQDDPEATLVAEDGVRDEAVPLPEPGDRVGRYEVIGRLGAGAIGVVYEARDPKLDRKVALKLLRRSGGPGVEATMQHTELLQEARVLAQLSHPNVVVVNDVGRLGEAGPVWIAMELVQGQTLGRWLQDQERSWDALGGLLREMGEALSAAHAAGIVHRDFKPANVMVSAQGRPRVLDFGLARPVATLSSIADEEDDDEADAPRDAKLRVEGTPAYMAPEQWLGEEVGPAADQFAYCVVVYEALTGDRPFDGEAVASIAGAVTRGEIRSSPREARLPAHVRRALRRGLATDPAERWPSMRALLQALAPRRRHVGGWLAGAGVLAVAVVGVGLWSMRAAVPDPCRVDPSRLAEVWGQAPRAAVIERLRSARPAVDPARIEDATQRLDAVAERWQTTWQQACEAARADPEGEGAPGEGAAQLDRRMRCLHEVRRDLGATVHALTEADGDTARRASELIEAVPSPDACLERLDVVDAPPPAIADAVERLEDGMAQVDVRRRLGHYEEAERTYTELLEQAEALGWSPLVVELRMGHASAFNGLARFEDAAAELERASALATELGDDAQQARTAIQLLSVYGYHLDRHDDADRWTRHAEAALQRLGPSAERRSELLNHLGLIAERRGEYERAATQHREALAIRREAFGDASLLVAQSHENLGNAERHLGNLDQARTHLEQTLAIRRARLGSSHPDVGATLTNLGNVCVDLQDFEGARTYYEESYDVLSAWLEDDHTRIAVVLNNLAVVAHATQRYDDAAKHLREALAINERRLGSIHAETLMTRFNLANVEERRGRIDEAIALAERVRRDAEDLSPPVVEAATALLEHLRAPAEDEQGEQGGHERPEATGGR